MTRHQNLIVYTNLGNWATSWCKVINKTIISSTTYPLHVCYQRHLRNFPKNWHKKISTCQNNGLYFIFVDQDPSLCAAQAFLVRHRQAPNKSRHHLIAYAINARTPPPRSHHKARNYPDTEERATAHNAELDILKKAGNFMDGQKKNAIISKAQRVVTICY